MKSLEIDCQKERNPKSEFEKNKKKSIIDNDGALF